jgi:tRNA pseudouridine38-40 synthase
MRTIYPNKNGYVAEIHTSNLVTSAYGNNYLDIAFTRESNIPSKVTLKYSSISFTLPVRYSQLATEQLDGVMFSLAWFRHYAPKNGTKNIELSVYADDTLLTTINYQLTAGKEEVELPVRIFEIEGVTYKEGDYIVFRIRANRFLRNMVRAIVGSLIEVGRGKKSPSWITELIASGSRSAAGQSVPGHALFFSGAEY